MPHQVRGALITGILGAGLLCLGAAGCAGEDQMTTEAPQEVTVEIQAALVDPTILTGGSLLLDVSQAGALIPSGARLLFSGQLGGQPLEAELGADLEPRDQGYRVALGWDKLSSVLGAQPGTTWSGVITVKVDDLGGQLTGVAELRDNLAFRDALDPGLLPPPSAEVFLNEVVSMPARGVLRQGEGATEVIAEGTFLTEGGQEIPVVTALPVEVGQDRAEALVAWPASSLGIQPGVFSGTLTPRNTHTDGEVRTGDAFDFEVRVLRTEIDGFDPPQASRGQIVSVVGRGLIPSDAQAGQSMFFLFDGMFQTRDGQVLDFSGDNAVQIAPERVPGHTEAQIVLRSNLEERSGRSVLTGLTATPGTFQGTLTPVLVDGTTTVRGQSFQGSLEVAPTQQFVFVKFLPSFSDALENFGLRNVEPEIRDRIFTVLRRDYGDFNLVFSDQRPQDFVEYSIIEVSGPDPNGAGLFGLDNSAGKDTGNVRLNDVIGGQNAESGELGYYVFGGVFIDSFTSFSPSLSNNSSISSPRFDDIFSVTTPGLGGTPVDAGEWPQGPRGEEIEEAIFVMGNLIGNTLVHEIGHSLGLAYFATDDFGDSTQFHNTFDEPGSIMDGGQDRPFEERAEIDGADAPRFNERNREYLQRILPLP
jgi:hypothetical protein